MQSNPPDAQKILFVACLPHSGSTLTALLLGHQPAMIGLGSIDKGVRTLAEDPAKTSHIYCSCGSPVVECPYWSGFVRDPDRLKGAGFSDRYSEAIRLFRRVFGSGKWMVDSSKLPDLVEQIHSIKNTDLRALHMCRDFRSSIVSAVDLKRSRKGVSRPGWLIGIEAAIRWHRRNTSIQGILEKNRIPHLVFGYEEMCLGLPRFAVRLGAFLETDTVTPPATIAGSKSHLITGNAMRRQKEKEDLAYDYRWFSRTDWIPASLLMPWLHACNRRWVYSNGFSGIFGNEAGNKWTDSKPAQPPVNTKII
jgi:hypothetical protein